MLALVDADVIMYKCGFSAQHKWYYVYHEEHEDYWVAKFRYKKEATEWLKDKENYTLTDRYDIEPLENALFLCKQLIKRIIKETRATKYQLYLTGDGNYREGVATILPYKGNRDNANKPFWYNEIKSYLIESWGAIVVEGYEADDALSMGQWNNPKGYFSEHYSPEWEYKTCICTTDKDLNGCPGLHYNWDKEEGPIWVTEAEARRFFYFQLLTGDKSVDNIPGVPGIGKAKANKILDGCKPEDYECKVGMEYAKTYSNPESAMEENARLLWMCRTEPNDYEWGF